MATLERFVARSNDRPEEVPLFFYHLPKTGGTTVDGVLSALAAVRRRRFHLVPREIGMREVAFPDRLRSAADTLVFAGHCLFGVHREIHAPVRLCTVLRDPVERVVSEYFWNCRVHGRSDKVSEGDFADYLDNIAVGNLMTRLLVGGLEIAWGAHERAIENLRTFHLVGSTERLDVFLEALLSSYGGATVQMARAKEERDPAKAVLGARLADAVAARNQLDMALYAHGERHLFQRADALLAAFSTPAANEVLVHNTYGKSFTVSCIDQALPDAARPSG